MPKTTFIAAAPDGSFRERTSQSRTYKFCVMARRSESYAKAQCTADGYPDAANHRHYRRIIEAGVGERYPFDNGRMSYYPVTEADFERANRQLAGCPDVYAYVAKMQAERLANHAELVGMGEFRTWHAEGWQSRLDLAEKFAAGLRRNPYYAEVAICAAEVKQTRRERLIDAGQTPALARALRTE